MSGTLSGLLSPDASIGRILVATDGTPASEPAVERAIQLAAMLHAGLLVLMVGGPGVHRAAAIRTLEEVVHRAADRGVAARWLHWRGDPGDAILSVADAEDVDLIVVGTHARPSGRSRARSVSGYVVRHGRRPVLVVQPWAEVAAPV